MKFEITGPPQLYDAYNPRFVEQDAEYRSKLDAYAARATEIANATAQIELLDEAIPRIQKERDEIAADNDAHAGEEGFEPRALPELPEVPMVPEPLDKPEPPTEPSTQPLLRVRVKFDDGRTAEVSGIPPGANKQTVIDHVRRYVDEHMGGALVGMKAGEKFEL